MPFPDCQYLINISLVPSREEGYFEFGLSLIKFSGAVCLAAFIRWLGEFIQCQDASLFFVYSASRSLAAGRCHISLLVVGLIVRRHEYRCCIPREPLPAALFDDDLVSPRNRIERDRRAKVAALAHLDVFNE